MMVGGQATLNNVSIISIWDSYQLEWISELYDLKKATCKEIRMIVCYLCKVIKHYY